MKKYFSHFCVGLLAVFMLILSCVPVFASSQSEYVQITNFLHWSKDVPIWGDFVSYSSSAICPVAEDGHHRASTYQSENVKEGYFDCICILCGKEFTAYESDLKQSYDNQVAELPATGITSAGRLIWQPTFADANANTSGSSDNYFRVSYYEGAYSCNVYLNAIPNCEAITIFSDNTGFICAYSNSYFKSRFGFYFNPVIAGSYRQIESLCYSYSCLDQSGTSYSGSVNYSAGTAFLHYDASTVLFSVRSSVFNICPDLSASATVTFGTVQYHFPVYEIIPDSAVDTSAGGQYSVTTRPTSITGGNYGIIGDDGEITTITNNNQIINETNNTYYNPATGESKPISLWTLIPSASPSWTQNGFSVRPSGRCSTATILTTFPKSPGSAGTRTPPPPRIQKPPQTLRSGSIYARFPACYPCIPPRLPPCVFSTRKNTPNSQPRRVFPPGFFLLSV